MQARGANRSRRAPARNLRVRDLVGHRMPSRTRVERGGTAQAIDPFVIRAGGARVRVLAEKVDVDRYRRVGAARLFNPHRNLRRDGLVQEILDRITGRPEVLDDRASRVLLGPVREIDGQHRTTRAAVQTAWPRRGLRQGGLRRVAPSSPLVELVRVRRALGSEGRVLCVAAVVCTTGTRRGRAAAAAPACTATRATPARTTT